MAGESVVGAVPDDLVQYATRATALNRDLLSQSETLGEALQAFIESNPHPKYIDSVPRLDKQVADLAGSAGDTDAWVARVGEGFRQADQAPVVTVDARANAPIGPAAPGPAPVPKDGSDDGSGSEAAGWSAGEKLANKIVHGAGKDEIARLVQQLRKHLHDPDYLAGFFNALGHRGEIRVILNTLKDDPASLKIFDQAFAAATHSGDLNNVQLLKLFPNPHEDPADYLQDLETSAQLLRYGTFSKTWLAHAFDADVLPWVLPSARDLPPLINLKSDPTALAAFNTVLHALARNPDADAKILSSSPTIDGKTFDPNITLLLNSLGVAGQGTQLQLGGLTAAIAAVTRDSDGLDRLHVLEGIAKVDPTRVPDGSRAAIARLLAKEIGNPAFGNLDNPVRKQNPWEEQIFIIALTNSSGTLDQGGLKALEGALHGWLQHHPQPPLSEPGKLSDWVKHYGNLVGLIGLGTRVGPYQAEQIASTKFDTYVSLLNDAAGPLGTISSIAFNHISAAVESHLAPSDANANIQDVNLWKKTLAGAQTYMVLNQIGQDPGLVPRSIRKEGPAAVRKFATDVASAGDLQDLAKEYPGLLHGAERNRLGTLILDKNGLAGTIDPYFVKPLS